MAKGDQINIKPHFKNEVPQLPCEGEAGDLFVTIDLNEIDLDEGEPDRKAQGSAQLWFCTKGAEGDGRNAVWKRVALDDWKDCTQRLTKPPQNTPNLRE